MALVLYRPSGAAPVAAASVDAIADQDDTAPFSPTLTANFTPSAYLWSVTGPATITGTTLASPTVTPFASGNVVVFCTATNGVTPVVAAVRAVLIGNGYPFPINPQPYDSTGIPIV